MSNKDGNVSNAAIPLPVPANPNKWICVQLMIPDSVGHRAAFEGAISNLATWRVWQRDIGHNAIIVSQLWAIARRSLKYGCDTKSDTFYAALGDNMPFFRQICEDGKCFLEFECCPGEWIRLGNADQLTAPGTTSGGEPTPPAGGGIQNYCKQFNANNVSLIPGLLNSGDVITLESADGSGYDGAGTQWYCSDGNQLFVTCQAGTGFLRSTDPLPSANHMSLLVQISGSFYHIAVGSSLTVPPGISNAQGWFQVNDAALSDNFGSYSLCYSVQNNAAVTWCTNQDFKAMTGGWQSFDDGDGSITTWVSGSGWHGGTHIIGGNNQQILDLKHPITISSVSGITIDYHIPPNGGGGYFVQWSDSAGAHSVVVSSTPGDHIGVIVPIGSMSVTELRIVLECDNTDGTPVIVSRAKIEGSGVNPFGLSNC
jgi:hypothetical protein